MVQDDTYAKEKIAYLTEVDARITTADNFVKEGFYLQLMANELPDLKLLYEGKEADFQKLCVDSNKEIDKITNAIMQTKSLVMAIVKARTTTDRNAKKKDAEVPKAKAKVKATAKAAIIVA